MKKFFVFVSITFCLFLTTACGKYGEDDLVKDLSKKIESLESYNLTATLEIYRNEEKYTYEVESSYEEDDNFRVSLINKNNNHEQIILKNEDGVYVLTPSLNKSFKFQSDWPYNNSQIYLLQPLISDMKMDEKRTFEQLDDGYKLKTSVNYSNDKSLVSQNIYIDKDLNITKVEILNKQNEIKMVLNIIEIDYKADFDDNYFNVGEEFDSQTKKGQNEKEESKVEEKEETDSLGDEKDLSSNTKETTSSESIVYPMYVPVDTYLSSQDVLQMDEGERIILTFAGTSPFTLIQETVSKDISSDFVSGDPGFILDTIGVISENSVNWISNNTEYYVVSESLDTDELLSVAQSISVMPIGK